MVSYGCSHNRSHYQISLTIPMTIPTIMPTTSANKEGIHAFRRTMFTSSHSHPPAGPATSTSDTSPRHQKRRLSLPGAVVLHSHSQTSLVFFIARTLNLRHRATHPRRKKEHKNRILCVSKRISFGPMLLLDKNVTLIPLSFR